MPVVDCPFCCQEAPLLFIARDLNQRVTAEKFPYYRCPQCGVIFLRPIPADLGRYYPQGYYTIPTRMDDSAPGIAAERDKLRLVRELFPPPARLLEVGPSWGTFAYVAKQSGYAVETIEMDARCCEFLEQKVGVRAVQSVDPTATLRAFPAEVTYDVIALWQVFEHLADPWLFLTAATERLRPGGVLILAVPNPQALQFRIFGRFWVHLDAPRHLQLVPAAALAQRGRELGLEQAQLTSADLATSAHRVFGWQHSIANLLGTHGGLAFRAIARLGEGVARIFSTTENRALRAVTYTLALRKPRKLE